MTTEAIPKLLFIDESTEELIDKRFSRQQLLIENDKKEVTKTWEYKWRSQAPLPNGYGLASTGKEDTSIFNAVYSNRNGALIYNSEKGIGVYGLDSIQEMTKDGKIVEPVVAINKKGSLFISPKETKLLVLNTEDLYFHSLDKDMPEITSVKNTHQFTNAFWENEEDLFLWSFESKVFRFCLTNSQFKEIDDIEKCTGIHKLSNDKTAILESMKLYIFSKGEMVKEIDLAAIENPNASAFEFMCMIGIAKLNNFHKEEFSDDDKYVLIAIYYTAYDEGDTEPCGRYAFYLKGDLYGDNLEVRGDDLIMVMKDKESYYLKEDQSTKIGFDCILERTDRFVLVLIEKIDYLFMIDGTEEFKKLGIFSTWPKHTYKLPENNSTQFFKGLAIMKNMLPFEKIAAPSDPFSKIYCNEEFEGQFMRLFFSHKECELTIEFPISAISFGNNFLIKKYVGCTVDSLEEEKEEEIIKLLKNIKKSRYITKVENTLELKNNNNQEQNIKQDPSQIPLPKIEEKQQQETTITSKSSTNPTKESPQNESIKTPETPININQQPPQNSIFAKKEDTLFSNPQLPQSQSNLFGNNTFAGKTIFNNTNSPNVNTTSPIGSKTFGSTNVSGPTFGTMFGGSNANGSIFNTTFGTSNVSGQTPGTATFGGMFSAPKLTSALSEKPKKSLTDKNNSESEKIDKINPVDDIGKCLVTEQKSIFNTTTENSTKIVKQEPKPIDLNFGLGGSANSGGLFGSSAVPKVQPKASPIITLDQKVELLKPTQSQPSGIFSQAQSTQKPVEKVQNNDKKNENEIKEQKEQKLKTKLEYFTQQMDSVLRKISLYETEENLAHLFSLNNSKKVIKSWDELINENSSELFESIEKVLPQLTTLEKHVKLKKVKESHIEEKQKIIKNFEKIYETIDISCYFVSSFQKTPMSNNNTQKSIFGSALKKSQIIPKNQETKFSSYATKRVTDLEKITTNLLNKYTDELYEIKKKQFSTVKKSITRFKFNSNEESDSSEEEQLENQNYFSTYTSRQISNTLTKSSVYSSGIRSRIKLQTLENFEYSTFSIETKKPFFNFESLEQSKTDQPKKKESLIKDNVMSKKEETTSKPFSSKVPPPNIKTAEIKTIPIMQNPSSEKSDREIVNSEKEGESEEEETVAPIIGNRTISSMPKKNAANAPQDNKELKPETKPTSTSPFGGFGLGASFGGNFASSGMFGAPKQNGEKTKVEESKAEEPIKTIKPEEKTLSVEENSNKANLFTNGGSAFGSISNSLKDKKPLDFSGFNITNKDKQKEKTETNSLVNKDETKQETKPENKIENQNENKTTTLTGLFAGKPFQFGEKKENEKEKEESKKKEEEKPSKQENLLTNLNENFFKKTNSTEDIKKPESTIPESEKNKENPIENPKPNDLNIPKPTTKEQEQTNIPTITNNNTTLNQNNILSKDKNETNENNKNINLFNSNTTQNNVFNQPKNQENQFVSNQINPQGQTQPFNQPSFPGHAATSFGSGNSRFNTSSSDQPQQQHQTFNPSAMSFGGGSALKSFSSVGNSNNNNLFGGQQGQQGQSSIQGWNQSNQSGNSWLNQNNSGNNNNNSISPNLNLLGQNQNQNQNQNQSQNQGWGQSSTFGQGSSQNNPFGQFGQGNTQPSTFGQGNTQPNPFGQASSQPAWGGQTGLFANAPSTGGIGATGFGANSSMMQPRK